MLKIKSNSRINNLKQREVDPRIVVHDDDVNPVLYNEAYKEKGDKELSDTVIGIPEQATI